MKNNKGLSLVELLIALAISAVVLIAVASIIFTCLRIFGRTNANVELQSSAQTTMNTITENIKAARGVYVSKPTTGGNTTFFALDEIVVQESGGAFNAYYKGNAIGTNIDETNPNGSHDIYLLSYPNDAYPEITNPADGPIGYTKVADGEGTRLQAVTAALDELSLYSLLINRDECLLSQEATSFRIEVADSTVLSSAAEVIQHTSGPSENIFYYTGPLALRVTVAFQTRTSSSPINSTLTDDVFSRNRLEYTYVDLNDGRGMLEYKRR